METDHKLDTYQVAFEPCLDGLTNMARDLALLDHLPLAARVYTWDDVWVTLGHSQVPEKTLVDPGKVKWVMRTTGGGAVLHGHDVTVGLAMELGGSVRHAYRSVTEPVIRALNEVGVPAVLAEDLRLERGGLHLADCFASISRNDIVDPKTMRKVCGCALRRTRNAVLLQASIPAGDPLVVPSDVIVGGVPTVGPHIDPATYAAALQNALNECSFATSRSR